MGVNPGIGRCIYHVLFDFPRRITFVPVQLVSGISSDNDATSQISDEERIYPLHKPRFIGASARTLVTCIGHQVLSMLRE